MRTSRRNGTSHASNTFHFVRRVRLVVGGQVDRAVAHALAAARVLLPAQDGAAVAGIRKPHAIASHQRDDGRRAAHARIAVAGEPLVDALEGVLQRRARLAVDERVRGQHSGQQRHYAEPGVPTRHAKTFERHVVEAEAKPYQFVPMFVFMAFLKAQTYGKPLIGRSWVFRLY